MSAANEIGTTQSVKTARLRCGIVPFTRLPSHGEGHTLGIIARREFITLLGGAAAAWPLTARAQPPEMPVVGFVHLTSVETNRENLATFRRGLEETVTSKART